MHALLARDNPPNCGLQDWAEFAGSWDDLAPDTYLAAIGLQRQRRHAVFSATPGGPVQSRPHQPHYQSLHYNRLQGDIKRWFEPVSPVVLDSISLRTILGFFRALFDHLVSEPPQWHIEIHQFRIEARAGQAGEPTPEGVHRDGVDYVLVLLIDRENIASGVTTIQDSEGKELGSFTLRQPFDAALVDDTRVYHGVTAVTGLDPGLPAHRDVLVITFRSVERSDG